SCFRSPGLSGLAYSGGDSLPCRASVPVAAAASTAPAVFDGSASGVRPRRCPQNPVPDEARDLVSPGKTRVLELSFRPEGGICVQVALKSRSLAAFGMAFRQPRAPGARAVTSLEAQRCLVD